MCINNRNVAQNCWLIIKNHLHKICMATCLFYGAMCFEIASQIFTGLFRKGMVQLYLWDKCIICSSYIFELYLRATRVIKE
jgi:hypothetical protein